MDWHWQLPKKSNWLELHQSYHSARNDYFRKISNFLNHHYAYSNLLADIFVKMLPHEKKQGLTSRSFHSLVKSLQETEYQSFVDLGEKVVSVNDYRSKEMNHKKLEKRKAVQISHKSPFYKSILKLEPVENDVSFEEQFTIPDSAPDDIVIQTISDKNEKIVGQQYIIHMAVCNPIGGEGSRVSFQPFYPYDYYNHLEEYGNHWHVFSRPGANKINIVDFFYSGGIESGASPDVWSAMLNLQSFTKKTNSLARSLAS